MARLAIGLAMLFATLLLAACGDSSPSQVSTASTASTTIAGVPQAVDTAVDTAVARNLLSEWDTSVQAALQTLTLYRSAVEAGDSADARSREVQVINAVTPMRQWGQEARDTFGRITGEAGHETILAGDAYAAWASEIIDNPANGSVAQATHIAALAGRAFSAHRAALNAAGAPLPAYLVAP